MMQSETQILDVRRKRSRQSRFLSITFDDGLLYGSEVGCDILARYSLAGTFYVVTGWVEPQQTGISDPYNKNRSHGDWQHWRRVRNAGHEVGSHSFSHVNAGGRRARLMPWIIGRELQKSHSDLAREVPQPSFTISMPWNVGTRQSERHARALYAACRLGSSAIAYNTASTIDKFRLASWAPPSTTTMAEYRDAIAGIPVGGWLIIQFHSFDNEGWDPMPSERFDLFCRSVANIEDLEVLPVAAVISRLSL